MTNLSQERLREIRSTLEAATPGPWHFNGNEVAANASPRVGIAGAMSEEDCQLIANAPEWISSLLDEIKRLQALETAITSLEPDLIYSGREIIAIVKGADSQ